jgi:hypothetical protein
MATPLDWGNHNNNMKLGYSAASAAKFKRSAKTKTNKQATTIFVLRRGGVDRHNSESTETSSQSRVVPRRVSRLRHKACDKLLDSKQGNLNTHSHNCNTPYDTGLQGMALWMLPMRIGSLLMLGGRQQNKFQRSETAEQVPKVKDSRTSSKHCANQIPLPTTAPGKGKATISGTLDNFFWKTRMR